MEWWWVFLIIGVSIGLAWGGGAPPLVCHVHLADPKDAYVTGQLQQAIHSCSQGNGTVVLAPGVDLTGALVLSGTVALFLPPGVVLLAGTRREDYQGPQSAWYLLRFHNCTGCRLFGGGTVDGQGSAWVLGSLPDRKLVRNFADPSCQIPEECRPRLVGVVDSSEVEVSGVELRDPIYWTLHIQGSQRVRVAGVRISSDWDIANTDGIDIDGSSDVEVSECDISTADDAICLKTSRPGRPTERVAVRGCRLRSRSSAVKLGSESRAAMQHITFTDLQIQDSHRGLAIQVREEGDVHNVSFTNIKLSTRYYNSTWWGGAEPIYVTASPRTPGTQVGRISNVSFYRIAARGENGIFIAGAEGSRVVGVCLCQTRLDLVKLTDWPGGSQDYRPGYRDLVHSGSTAPVWAEHAEHLLFDHVTVAYHAPFREDWETTPHIQEGTVADLEFRDFAICMASPDGPLCGPSPAPGAES